MTRTGTDRLRITVFNASGLRAADTNGLSDPYVVGEIVGKPHSKFKTRAIQQTLDPEWDEEHTIRDFLYGDVLRFTVMDQDNPIKQAFMGDDLLGRVELNSDEFYHGFTGELRLRDAGKGHDHAVLRLAIAVEAMPQMEDTRQGSKESVGSGQRYAPAPPTSTLPYGAMSAGSHDGYSPDPSPPSNHRPLKRISVTIVGVQGLHHTDHGKSLHDHRSRRRSTFCVCEVPGKQHTRFQTEVEANVSSPRWNRNCEFDYTPMDPLVFSVYEQGHYPKQDEVLGKAVLRGEKFHQYGFDGELVLESHHDHSSASSMVESLKGTLGRMVGSTPTHSQSATLTVRVEVLRSIPEREEPYMSPRYDTRPEVPAYRPEPVTAQPGMSQPTSQYGRVTTGSPYTVQGYSGSHRLRIRIRSLRSMGLGEEAARSSMHCVCQVGGRPGSGFQTRAASASAGSVTWDQESEIPNYLPGEPLEVLVLGKQRTAASGLSLGAEEELGRCVLSTEQFFPFGYDAEATLSHPGLGIQGLLKLQVQVLDPPGQDQAGTRQVSSLASRSLGANHGAGLVSRTGLGLSGRTLGLSSTASEVRSTPSVLRSEALPRRAEPIGGAALVRSPQLSSGRLPVTSSVRAPVQPVATQGLGWESRGPVRMPTAVPRPCSTSIPTASFSNVQPASVTLPAASVSIPSVSMSVQAPPAVLSSQVLHPPLGSDLLGSTRNVGYPPPGGDLLASTLSVGSPLDLSASLRSFDLPPAMGVAGPCGFMGPAATPAPLLAPVGGGYNGFSRPGPFPFKC